MSVRRGRPPADWISFERAVELPTRTAVLVDRGWHNGGEAGRVVDHGRGELRTVDRRGTFRCYSEQQVVRVRVIPSLFDEGEPVLLDGVSADRWRGGVVSTRVVGDRVLVRVETLDGFETHDESRLRRADDVAAQQAYEATKTRRGRPRSESWQEEEAQRRYREGDEEPWAV